MLRSGSWLISLTLPLSMTTVTSSMVMDVSATLVDSTTLNVPAGGLGEGRGQLFLAVG